MDVYLYLDRNTFIHRLDPRAKMLALLSALLLGVAADHPVVPGAMLLLALVTVHIARAWPSLRRVRTLLLIIWGFSTVSWSFVARGTTPLLGPIEYEALLYGIGTGFKLVATIVASVVFLATTKNEEIATGLIRIGLPHAVAFAFSTALRLVPTFVGAGATIIQGQRSRGLDVESGSLIARMRKHLPLMVPVFASAIRSTNQLSMALESKGFGAQRQRTYLLALKYGAADWVVSLGALFGLAGALYLRAFSSLGHIPGLFR